MRSVTVFLTTTFFFCIATAMASQPEKLKFHAVRRKAADTSLAVQKSQESQARQSSSLGTVAGYIMDTNGIAIKNGAISLYGDNFDLFSPLTPRISGWILPVLRGAASYFDLRASRPACFSACLWWEQF